MLTFPHSLPLIVRATGFFEFSDDTRVHHKFWHKTNKNKGATQSRSKTIVTTKALNEIGGLMDARPNTAEGDRLDVLVTLVAAWEETHWPLDYPDPVEATSERGITWCANRL
jgi:hypothetical protein